MLLSFSDFQNNYWSKSSQQSLLTGTLHLVLCTNTAATTTTMGLAVRFNVRTLMYILLVVMVLLILDLCFMLSIGGRNKNKFVETKSRYQNWIVCFLYYLTSTFQRRFFYFHLAWCLKIQMPGSRGCLSHVNVCNHGNVLPSDLINVVIVRSLKRNLSCWFLLPVHQLING